MSDPRKRSPVLAAMAVGSFLACRPTDGPRPPDASRPEEPPPVPTASDLATPSEDDAPRGDSVAAALACGEEMIRRYNDEARADDGEALLFEAARCYRDAGKPGHALRALKVMVERHPDGPHRAEGLVQMRVIFHMIEDEHGAVGTPRGQQCLGNIHPAALDAVPAEELERAATCLYEDAFIGSALVLRKELAGRSLSDEQRASNDERIIKLERGLAGLARTRAALIE